MKTTRQIAEGLLTAAKEEFDLTPNGAPAQVVMAHSARAQFYATAALTNAVLDMTEAIRETGRTVHVRHEGT